MPPRSPSSHTDSGAELSVTSLILDVLKEDSRGASQPAPRRQQREGVHAELLRARDEARRLPGAAWRGALRGGGGEGGGKGPGGGRRGGAGDRGPAGDAEGLTGEDEKLEDEFKAMELAFKEEMGIVDEVEAPAEAAAEA